MAPSLGRMAATAAALLALTLTGCSGDDGAEQARPDGPPGPRIEHALSYLPADSRAVVFTDRAAVADRLDLGDIETGASEADTTRWADAFWAEGYRLAVGVRSTAMRQAAFSELDVEWEALGGPDGGGIGLSARDAHIWRMSEDLDLDAVADDLEDAGLKRSGPDERPVFEPDFGAVDDQNTYGGRYPMELGHLTLVPDEHLILIGLEADAVLDVIDGKADSLASAGTFDELLAHTEPAGLEYALFGVAGPCTRAGRVPEGRSAGLFLRSDQPARTLRLFESAESAQADASQLEEELSGHPVTIGVEDAAVHVDVPFADRITATKSYLGAGGPTACPR
ncbi:hypothetical protein RB608_26935 [Nocardioides sp. LHD-245]|uniref:hypothetical protein n=1 Tax=Nocardioides sp. LHD-245 TaxID=3051387 RepID=UPI0027E140F0|nr:hypothetical protein [Nocardioides sp. LHD-245]